MREQCDTCAFKEGCVTHENEPHNRLRGMICALGGIPFYCHYEGEKDWSLTPVWKVDRAQAIALRKRLPICQGWRAEVKALNERGHFRSEVAKARRFIAVYALQQIDNFIQKKGKAKKAAELALQRSLQMLRERKVDREELSVLQKDSEEAA